MIENATFFVENVSEADLPFCYHHVCIVVRLQCIIDCDGVGNGARYY